MHSTLNIGGLRIALEGGDGVRHAMMLPGMRVFAAEEAAPQLTFMLDCDIKSCECQWLHNFSVADSQVECRFGIDQEGRYWYDFAGHGRLCCDLNTLTFQFSPFAHPAVLRFALWAAYSMGGLMKGRLPVHTSVVVCYGRAVLCLGESGTGKSTHTRLWLENIGGTHLLNDDSPIMGVVDGQAIVYGSPWSGKTDCYLQESYPVAALQRIVQYPDNIIKRLGTLEAFAALQPSCPPCLMKEDRLKDLLVAYVGSVLVCTPVYRLACRPDAEAAHLSHKTIFG